MRKKRSEMTEEELQLARAKRQEWYRTRSPEYKEELLARQRAYTLRKKKEREEANIKVHREYHATKEAKRLHSEQNAIRVSRRLAELTEQLKESGIYDKKVCTHCLAVKDLEDFKRDNGNGYGKLCKRCRESAYRSTGRQAEFNTESYWKYRAANINKVAAKALVRKGFDVTSTTIPDLITGAELFSMYKKQKGRCYYCNMELDERLQADHKTPLSASGTNTADNIALVCPECNRLKHTSDAVTFSKFLLTYAKSIVEKSEAEINNSAGTR